jgi:hypothetical protein
MANSPLTQKQGDQIIQQLTKIANSLDNINGWFAMRGATPNLSKGLRTELGQIAKAVSEIAGSVAHKTPTTRSGSSAPRTPKKSGRRISARPF